ncbi:MAG: undecaprenyl/decaprenyl-phosphate alpha-N-acetylglucosaminyl 1-phosphate transferase [Promicromonosporaceae bacterium]|nr:undecaprenyl/decaprenyl-phosphate alpha-N-acetylglucosaminyl 1-phosphate transferase [Promicromonosporaceae bacterium]
MRVYLLLMLIAAAVTYLSTPIARMLARKTQAISAVRARDVHVRPTARLGGLAIVAGIVVAVLIASHMPFLSDVFASREVWGITGAALLVALLGWADDVWDLDWLTKLVGQILAAGFMAVMHVQLTTWPLPGQLTIPGSRLSLAVTILFVVATMNAVNFIDGLDGLAAGVIAIGGAAFFVYTYGITLQASPQDFSSLASLMLAVLVGACLGFLPHNFFPAHIFMGDSGSQVLGLVLAGATISVTGHVNIEMTAAEETIPAFVPLLLPVAIILLPFLDMILSVARRLLKGKSPFAADRMHLHHRLLALGHSHRRAVIIMYLWTALFGFAGAALVWWGWRQVLIGTGIGAVVSALLTIGPLRTHGRLLDDDVATGQVPAVSPLPEQESP